MKFRMNKSNNLFNVVLGLGLVVVIVVLFNYNNNKSSIKDNMYDDNLSMDSCYNQNVIGPVNKSENSDILGASVSDSNYLPVTDLNTSCSQGSCNNQQITNPSDLLPKDINSDWSNINPANADLKNINLLSAGQLIGINTIGSSLRNSNLQERPEPVIPKTNIGPWNNSTIESDNHRRPLEN
jgi:hypothetical protein